MSKTGKKGITKKLFVLMLALVMVFAGTACQRGGGAQSQAPQSTAPAAAENNMAAEPEAQEAPATTAAAPEYTIKVGHITDEENSLHKGFVLFKDYVEKESGGRVAVEIFPNGLLGGDRELVEGVELGTIQMTGPASTVLVSYDSNIGILDMPFLFRDEKAAMNAVDGDLGKKIDEIMLDKIGVINFGYGYNGARSISNSVRPINEPADLNGIKIRVMESPIYIDTFKALGANPTPMSFGEVFTALQQGTVDAQDNAPPLTVSARFYEVQKYYSVTGHTQSLMPIMINAKFFESLPADLQKIVQEGARKYAVEEQRKFELADTESALNTMKDSGKTEVNYITPENYEKFVAAVQSVYEKNQATIDPALFDIAQSYNK